MNLSGTARPLLLCLPLLLTGCGGSTNKPSSLGAGVPPRAMADYIHAVLAADRAAYSRYVINRLAVEEKIIKATEHWKDERTLPLPAQMLRLSSEIAQEKYDGLSYSLLSMWPINHKNLPRTDAEKTGLKHILEHPGEAYYAEEVLGDKRYFTAIYPDVAVAQACADCHNGHPDSPRVDFKVGDTMGGMVIRFPL